MITKIKNSSYFRFFLLTIAFIVYSCESLFSKLASTYESLSLPFLIFFGLVIVALGIYAVLWQKILEFMPLNIAYLCKSSTIVIILVMSNLIFNENITVYNIIGAGLIFLGLIVLLWKK